MHAMPTMDDYQDLKMVVYLRQPRRRLPAQLATGPDGSALARQRALARAWSI